MVQHLADRIDLLFSETFGPGAHGGRSHVLADEGPLYVDAKDVAERADSVRAFFVECEGIIGAPLHPLLRVQILATVRSCVVATQLLIAPEALKRAKTRIRPLRSEITRLIKLRKEWEPQLRTASPDSLASLGRQACREYAPCAVNIEEFVKQFEFLVGAKPLCDHRLLDVWEIIDQALKGIASVIVVHHQEHQNRRALLMWPPLQSIEDMEQVLLHLDELLNRDWNALTQSKQGRRRPTKLLSDMMRTLRGILEACTGSDIKPTSKQFIQFVECVLRWLPSDSPIQRSHGKDALIKMAAQFR